MGQKIRQNNNDNDDDKRIYEANDAQCNCSPPLFDYPLDAKQ